VGGGQAVQLYAYNELVGSRHWLTAERWAEAFGICRVVPGINLIALALLTGADLDGMAGAAASTIGLLLPSVLITVAIAAVYAHLATVAVVQGALEGVIAAAAGMSVAVGWRIVNPALRSSRADGWHIAAVTLMIVIVSALLVVATNVAIYGIFLGAGALMGGLLWFTYRGRPAQRG
jgi:chromate transporter